MGIFEARSGGEEFAVHQVVAFVQGGDRHNEEAKADQKQVTNQSKLSVHFSNPKIYAGQFWIIGIPGLSSSFKYAYSQGLLSPSMSCRSMGENQYFSVYYVWKLDQKKM